MKLQHNVKQFEEIFCVWSCWTNSYCWQWSDELGAQRGVWLLLCKQRQHFTGSDGRTDGQTGGRAGGQTEGEDCYGMGISMSLAVFCHFSFSSG